MIEFFFDNFNIKRIQTKYYIEFELKYLTETNH